MGTAIKSLHASHVTAVIPWMGYSKQDKEFRRGEAVSANLVAKLIEAAGFDRVITMELHSENVMPYFHIPVTELSSHGLLSSYLRQEEDIANMVVASPDKGGKSRSARFATEVGLPIVYLEKERDLATGDVVVTNVSEPVVGRDVIIFDDIINTGATAIKVSAFLKSQGAGAIYFLATHAVFAGEATAKLKASSIDRVMVTDTIQIPKEKHTSKLTVVSVAPIIAEAIRKNS